MFESGGFNAPESCLEVEMAGGNFLLNAGGKRRKEGLGLRLFEVDNKTSSKHVNLNPVSFKAKERDTDLWISCVRMGEDGRKLIQEMYSSQCGLMDFILTGHHYLSILYRFPGCSVASKDLILTKHTVRVCSFR